MHSLRNRQASPPKTCLSGLASQKLRKLGEAKRKWGHRATRAPRHTQHGETLTWASKRPRAEGSTPTQRIKSPKRPRNSRGPEGGLDKYKSR
jgi:hypothetical protein